MISTEPIKMKSYPNKQLQQCNEHGEVISEETISQKYIAKGDTFYLMYSSLVTSFLQKSHDINVKLFGSLLKRYANGHEFSMNKGLKEIIAKECHCSVGAINNAVTRLKETKMIYEVARRTYKINPVHVYQGSSKVRKKLVVELEQDCPECLESHVEFI